MSGGDDELLSLGVDGEKLLITLGRTRTGLKASSPDSGVLRQDAVADLNVLDRHWPGRSPNLGPAGKAGLFPDMSQCIQAEAQ